MRNFLFSLLLSISFPTLSLAQTIKIIGGAAISTVLPHSKVNISTGIDNVLIGGAASVGLDYSETKWGFLSTNIGLVQKGRRDKVVFTDPLGNEAETKTQRTMYSFATINTTMNFKLSKTSVIPFFSIGPRVDYLLNQKDFYDPKDIKFGFGLNGGFGLLKRFGNMEFGGRIDYLLNLAEHFKDRTGTVQVFFGHKIQ